MFDKSIDEKPLFIDEYGVETTDIGESFLNPDGAEVELYSVYKVPDDMEMRPDKVSLSMYGTDKYTEIVCAYNDFRNPFTIQKDDVINLVSLQSVYNNVYEPSYDTDSSVRTKNNGALLSKYIDRSKAPDTAGSQRNAAVVSKNRRMSASGKQAAAVLPPNMAGIGVPAVEIKNGRVYFGANATNYSSKGNSSLRTANSLSSIMSSYNRSVGKNAASGISSDAESTTDSLSNMTANIISGEYGQGGAVRTADEIISDINVADMTVELMRAATSGAESGAYADTVKSLRDAGMSNSYINDVISAVNGGGASGNAARTLAAAGMTPAAIQNIASHKATDKSSVVSPNSGMIDKSGVETKNGRVYFGSDTSVGCADNGMSAGDYMTDSIKNKIKG